VLCYKEADQTFYSFTSRHGKVISSTCNLQSVYWYPVRSEHGTKVMLEESSRVSKNNS